MSDQKVLIRFVNGPDDGLVADSTSSDTQSASIATAMGGALRKSPIGQPYYGLPMTLAIKLGKGVPLTELAPYAQQHAYRKSEHHETAECLELVMLHDPAYKPRFE